MTKLKDDRYRYRGKNGPDRSKVKCLVLRFNRWVDHNHCRITLGARVDSPEFDNRCFSMGLAQKLFPSAGFDRVAALTLMSLTYLAILTFRRVFVPLGDQKS